VAIHHVSCQMGLRKAVRMESDSRSHWFCGISNSLNVPSLNAHFELYKTLMRGRSDLTRVQREMIAVVVSTANRCHY